MRLWFLYAHLVTRQCIPCAVFILIHAFHAFTSSPIYGSHPHSSQHIEGCDTPPRHFPLEVIHSVVCVLRNLAMDSIGSGSLRDRIVSSLADSCANTKYLTTLDVVVKSSSLFSTDMPMMALYSIVMLLVHTSMPLQFPDAATKPEALRLDIVKITLQLLTHICYKSSLNKEVVCFFV